MAARHTFSKAERLTNKKTIDGLFGPVSHIKQFPLRLNILPVEEPHWDFPAQVVIIVSKRNFKKAHERNYYKRVLRELYRQNKSKIYKSIKKGQYGLALILGGNKKYSFAEMQEAMDALIQKTITYFETLD